MKIAAQLAILASIIIACIPAHAADPANGRRLSERWCATCHVVSAEQRQGTTDAPAFAFIGRQPDFDAGRLALFLLDPHPKMPAMALTRTEATDIATYIKTLGRSN